MADKDFSVNADWPELVPTLTGRDEVMLWRIDAGGLAYEADAGRLLYEELERAKDALREQRRAFKRNPRRIELEQVIQPILNGSDFDLPGTYGPDWSAKMDEVLERRARLAAEAGLTPEAFKAMHQELQVLRHPVSEAEAALQTAEKRREFYFVEAHRYAQAVCYSEGKREGFRSAVRHLLLNPANLEGKDKLARIMKAMLDDQAADSLISSLTKHDTAPLWPDEKDEAEEFFHGSDDDDDDNGEE